jgi:hypothetical protein
MSWVSRRLAQNGGRYYVLGQFAVDEDASAGLDRQRAEAIMDALVRAGFCPEKLVVLPGGLSESGAANERSGVRPMGQLILISDYANDQLRRAGILK